MQPISKGKTPTFADFHCRSSELAFHENTVRIVFRVIAEARGTRKSHFLEEGERIGLVDAGLQPHHRKSRIPRRLLQCLDEAFCNAEPTCTGRDVHSLDLRIVRKLFHRAAAQSLTV